MASQQHTVRESIHTKLQETGEKDRYGSTPWSVCLREGGLGGRQEG
eukprot:COSAG02_NODE_1681_length_11351_cov_20.077320_9_plen_46_part_00